jgi:hypothetical protein
MNIKDYFQILQRFGWVFCNQILYREGECYERPMRKININPDYGTCNQRQSKILLKVPATCYQWWLRSDSGVWGRPSPVWVSSELRDWVSMCRRGIVRQWRLLSSGPADAVEEVRERHGYHYIRVHGWYRCCAKHSERNHEQASGRSFHERPGGSMADSIRGYFYCLARELSFITNFVLFVFYIYLKKTKTKNCWKIIH